MKKEESRFADGLIFEGMTSIRAVLAEMETGSGDRRILRIIYQEDKSEKRSKELAYLRHASEKHGFSLESATEEYLDSLTTGNTHGGIIAECTRRTIPDLVGAQLKANGFYVMIEGIEDPYNFGYAIRSIYASGADGIILTPRNWMSAAGVVARSSAGTSELIPLYQSESEDAAMLLKSKGYKIACAGIRDSVSAFDADLKKPLLLIIGGEKRGISRSLLDLADITVRLDYGREFNGSLSAASAASILAYEVLRQNR